jgi:hypothetical protein
MKRIFQGKGRRITSFVCMAVMMATVITGCGSAKAPDGYYVLNGITEKNHTVKGDALEGYGLDGSYIVMEDGKGYICLMDTPEDVSFDNGVLSSSFGNIAVKNSGKKLTLSDNTVKLEFVKSDDSAPSKPSYPSVPGAGGAVASGKGKEKENSEAEPGNGSDNGGSDITFQEHGSSDSVNGDEDIMSFWNGYWFGYWTLEAWDSNYKKMEGVKFPVLGVTTLDENGQGTMYLWDNEYNVANVAFSNNGTGLTDKGTMVSEGGVFWDGDNLGHADWRIDPGQKSHDGYIWITGKGYYEGKLSYEYEINLVKWGYRWEDFDDSERPDEYGWYIQQLDAGVTNPSTVALPSN